MVIYLSGERDAKKGWPEFENELRKIKDELERITGFIAEYGTKKDLCEEWEYACNVCDVLSWILGGISTEDFLSEDYLNINKLREIVKQIESRTGQKFENYY